MQRSHRIASKVWRKGAKMGAQGSGVLEGKVLKRASQTPEMPSWTLWGPRTPI